MLSFKDNNLDLIRDFSEEQFLSHITFMEEIKTENEFGDTGVDRILEKYIELLYNIQKIHQQGQEEFRLTKNETLLYDLSVEIARLCYKHSLNTSLQNDWEEEFK